MPTVPPEVLNPGVIALEAEANALEQARRAENRRLLTAGIAERVGHVVPGLMAVAQDRLVNGKFEHTSRVRGTKKSSWEDTTEGRQDFVLDFRSRRKKVTGVDTFRFTTLSGNRSVKLAISGGKLYEVRHEYDPQDLKRRYKTGEITPLEDWMLETIILRGHKAGLGSRTGQGEDSDPGLRGELTFRLDSSKLILASYLGSGPTSSGWQYNSESYRFLSYSSASDRFATGRDIEGLSPDEIDTILKIDSRGSEFFEKLLRDKYAVEIPIVTADEYLTGLELVLDTVPQQ